MTASRAVVKGQRRGDFVDRAIAAPGHDERHASGNHRRGELAGMSADAR